MKRNTCSIWKIKTPTRKTIIKTLGLSLAIALVLAPVANLAVVRDNVGGMDTSVSQEGNTPNGGATEDQILEGYGAYVDGKLVEGNIPTANVTDSIINDLNDKVTIPGHTYIDKDLTIGLSSTFLKDATSDATATANKMLQGETAYVDGTKLTGTMTNNSGATKESSTVSENGDNVYISIPEAGYYDKNSKISISAEYLQNNTEALNPATYFINNGYSALYYTGTWPSYTATAGLRVESGQFTPGKHTIFVMWTTWQKNGTIKLNVKTDSGVTLVNNKQLFSGTGIQSGCFQVNDINLTANDQYFDVTYTQTGGDYTYINVSIFVL